jgi:hypothetical protein
MHQLFPTMQHLELVTGFPFDEATREYILTFDNVDDLLEYLVDITELDANVLKPAVEVYFQSPTDPGTV